MFRHLFVPKHLLSGHPHLVCYSYSLLSRIIATMLYSCYVLLLLM
uniref:Cyclin-dependent kinase F-4 n=1 Tax=Rhizophora mucronata TaxID=61149 RepID=A0A2P2JPE9_RHIMU